MLVQIADKQRRAVSVVKTALASAGIHGRAVCVTVESWLDLGGQGRSEYYAVFVAAQSGMDVEPFFVTGGTIVEAVRNMIVSIKGRANGTTAESTAAPF